MVNINTLNKWQKHYIDTIYNGRAPRSKAGKRELELLGKVKETVTVHFPDFNGIHGLEPAHTETYRVELDKCNMPKGIIRVDVLAGNLALWTERGYAIDY